jgi:HSP20 family protein
MSTIKWPQLTELHQKIDRLLGGLLSDEPWSDLFTELQETDWVPAIELRETETTLLLQVNIPGLAPDQLDIQLMEGNIFLTGYYPEVPDNYHQKALCSEFRYGQFRRIIPLPATIYWELATAEVTNGLLTLVMPKLLATVMKSPLPLPDRAPIGLIAARHLNHNVT